MAAHIAPKPGGPKSTRSMCHQHAPGQNQHQLCHLVEARPLQRTLPEETLAPNPPLIRRREKSSFCSEATVERKGAQVGLMALLLTLALLGRGMPWLEGSVAAGFGRYSSTSTHLG